MEAKSYILIFSHPCGVARETRLWLCEQYIIN